MHTHGLSTILKPPVCRTHQQAEAAREAELRGPHAFTLARLSAVYARLLAADESHSVSSISRSCGGLVPSTATAATAGTTTAAATAAQQQSWRRPGRGRGAGGGWLGVHSSDVLAGVSGLVSARLLSQVMV